MRRLVWIGAALLIMVGIFGYALFTMRHIEQVNQERREREKGNDIAVQIAATTATTNIWERLRGSDTVTVETGETQSSEDKNAMHQAQGLHPTEEPEEESTDTATSFAEPETPSEEETGLTIIINP